MADLPCDADGMCMVCKVVPLDEEVLLCSSCVSPWHMQCLHPPLTSVPLGDWECPDCNMPSAPPTSSSHAAPVSAAASGSDNDMVGKIRAIQADKSLTEEERARKRQELMANQSAPAAQNGKAEKADAQTNKPAVKGRRNETLEMLDENLNCIFCMNLPERPVTTPCGHNFCLKCFQRWIGQGKKSCGKCRAAIPAAMANQPRINSALVMAIRLAKAATSSNGASGPPKQYHHIENEKRPDKCFTTDRAVKTGKANACSGRIFVTIAPDHFGPILAENDPSRGQGVLVGESWEDRMECRQWGAHFPHVAGIAGQSDFGAQSVALSGGYEDDEDHGEWFLYTGSGGRDLSGNKRTNKEQSFDQKFDKSNEALRVSCKRGYPVRVVRSHKEKRSAYAPEKGVRYDGVYRIEMCWRKKGIQGHKVCRYLFVRCDNEPAPWTSDEIGDRKRPLPTIGELKEATDIYERKTEPSWDFREDGETWGWTKNPPESRKTGGGGHGEKSSRRKQLSIQQKLLKEFGCSLCRKVLQLPLSTPCGHNFCQSCLVAAFAGQQDMRERLGVGGRSLRIQKLVKRCPTCKGDISDFMSSPKVNRQMDDLIQNLKSSIADGDEEEIKAVTNTAEKDAEDQEAREQIVKDSDDESDSPAGPPSNGHSKVTENGHSNGSANGKVVEHSATGQSNGLASEKLVTPDVNRQELSLQSAKDTSSEHVTEREVEITGKVANRVPKKRGRPPSNGHSKLTEDGHSNGSANGKVVEHSANGHSNGLASEKLVTPDGNGQALSLQSGKNTSSEHVTEREVEIPAKVANRVPKKRGRPPSNGHSKLFENGHSNGLGNGKVVEPSVNGQSNGLASEKLVTPNVNGQELSLQTAKGTSSEHVTEREVDIPAMLANKVPKKRGRKVVKDSDEELSDADCEYKVPAKRNRVIASSATVVLDSDDETEAGFTPSKRYTRGQHTAAVSSMNNTMKALGGSLEDVITL